MRISVDLPDHLYRTVKARAAQSGIPLRELVIRCLELGLNQPAPRPGPAARAAPPVMIPSSGHAIRPVTGKQAARPEEAEDLAKHGRSA